MTERCDKPCVYPELRCLNCGEAPQWSSERPTEPGWYWAKTEIGVEAVRIACVENDGPRLMFSAATTYAGDHGRLYDAFWLRVEVPE